MEAILVQTLMSNNKNFDLSQEEFLDVSKNPTLDTGVNNDSSLQTLYDMHFGFLCYYHKSIRLNFKFGKHYGYVQF